jgi:hypothetical protein
MTEVLKILPLVMIFLKRQYANIALKRMAKMIEERRK